MKELPKTSRLLKYGDHAPPPGSRREGVRDRLLEKCTIGLKLPKERGGDDAPVQYEQNYIAVSSQGPFFPKLFLHGREIFTSKEIADQFAVSDKSADESYVPLLTPALVNKVSHLFSPDTFEQRLIGYTMPRERGAYVQAVVSQFQQQYPDIDFSSLPPVTEENAHTVMGDCVRLLEKTGIDSTTLLEDQLAPPESLKQQIRDYIRENYPQSFDANIAATLPEGEKRDAAIARKDEVLAYAAQHHYDPEIIQNFAVGLLFAQDITEPVEPLLELGGRVRANAIIGEAARSVANPYDEKFAVQEARVANIIAGSVEPRVLEHITNHNIGIVVADAEDSSVFRDIVAFPEKFDGKFESLKTRGDDVFNDMIIIASPGLKEKRLAFIARHECEHALDMTNHQPFQMMEDYALWCAMESDRRHLDQTHDIIKEITPESAPAVIEQLHRLARMVQLEGSEQAILNPEDVLRLKEKMLEYLDVVQDRVSTFMPRDENAPAHEAYSAKLCQTMEIPAVIEDVKATFGKNFVRELLPEIYDLCRQHRMSHPAMRRRDGGVGMEV